MSEKRQTAAGRLYNNGVMRLDQETCYRAVLARDVRFDGRFFTAVKTTGVYCRPVCPARAPKLLNCVFLPSAAAAQEAGYRPCLRCRPESSPNLSAWHGTYASVSRAMRLIEDGALDHGDVEGLSERLGVSSRHLRRLFRQHLGASPLGVAQTRRILLAKQLLNETQLPLAEIAYASGFKSIRRFNETFQHLYGAPPGALRHKAEGPPSAVNSAIPISLPYRAPYDWRAMLAFLSAREMPGVEQASSGAYRRTILLKGEAGWIEVKNDAPHSALRAVISLPRFQHLPLVIARLRSMFDLAADPLAISRALSRDPLLAARISMRPGLRVPGTWDGFETAVRAVLGQQITVAAATWLAGKLVAAFGSKFTGSGAPKGLTHLFPCPEQLVRQDIAGIGMPRARGAAIASLAAAAIANPDLFAPYHSLEDAVAQLRLLPGIGEWTAHYIAMRGLRESDAFPSGDIALMRAMADADGKRPSAAGLLSRAENWRPWRAYAAVHLWAADAASAVANANAEKDTINALAD